MQVLALSLFVAGASVSTINFHLSFVRPLICRLRQRTFSFVSGFPLFGSLSLIMSFFSFPSDNWLRWAALIIALFDTGGIHWFGGTMLYRALRKVRSRKEEG